MFWVILHLIPAGALQEGGESKNVRAINVPGLKYRLPTPPAPNAHHPRRAKGQTPQLLAELICINMGQHGTSGEAGRRQGTGGLLSS